MWGDMGVLEHEAVPRFLIVGAGLSGAVLARTFADAGCYCDVLDEQSYVGGGCRTISDEETGILVHRKGPHTLHSDDPAVWAFVERFSEIYPYRHLKRALTGGELYVSPINLQTLNQFFHTTLGPDEARSLVETEAAPYLLDHPPANFEEAGLAMIGRRLFDAFYRGYTIKQWGVEPRELPASIFGRAPIRFDYNDNYFRHGRQGQPIGGYSLLTERILRHANINVSLGRAYDPLDPSETHRHVFYSGPIDRYFAWQDGRLPYRSVRFDDVRSKGLRQGCAVIICCDQSVPYTRTTEHKHFSPYVQFEGTIVSYEYSSDCGDSDTPDYPLHVAGTRAIFESYAARAYATPGVSFLGRLGTYRYIDMDTAIREAMDAGARTLAAIRTSAPIPTFFIAP
jgi:UDP-galactopyranose mutase